MKSVLLVGYFGQENPGDEATLLIIRQALEAGEIPYTVFYQNGAASAIKIIHAKKALSESSALIMCGGNLLQNETSNGSLLYYLYIIRIAAKMGVPIFFVSSGIGRIFGNMAKKQTERTLRHVAFFGARTAYDFTLANSCSVGDCHLMPDVCFSMPSVPI